jgi:hypothetical protein
MVARPEKVRATLVLRGDPLKRPRLAAARPFTGTANSPDPAVQADVSLPRRPSGNPQGL